METNIFRCPSLHVSLLKHPLRRLTLQEKLDETHEKIDMLIPAVCEEAGRIFFCRGLNVPKIGKIRSGCSPERTKNAFEPYPQCGIAVSINGKIYRDTWDQALPQDAEIYLPHSRRVIPALLYRRRGYLADKQAKSLSHGLRWRFRRMPSGEMTIDRHARKTIDESPGGKHNII